MDNLKKVSYLDIDITDGFWQKKQKLNSEISVYAVQHRFEDTGRFEAFNFNWTEGCDLPEPHYFWDSDIAKWLESAAYIVAKNHDENLTATIHKVVDQIEEHQQEDGYFNIYHTVVRPEEKLKDRDHHELYCLGHLIEAAVAIHDAMGEDKLIEILDRYIDLVIKLFCVEKSVPFTTPGHEEIELALFRLYEIKPDKKYLDLAMFFLNNRGVKEEIMPDWMKNTYNQSHLPVRQQHEAFGHSVRACYLYSGMASAADVTRDEEMLDACKDLFDDITNRKMYISGGIGSAREGEAFTIAYDLPSDRAYTESCAGIALAMFANRMKDIDIDSKYADTIERLIYNGILSSISLDGKSFFYENPMEINLADHDRFTATNDWCGLPNPERSEVFGCSCCPPNITRFLASLGDYFISYSGDTIYLHQFAEMTAKADGAELKVETNYPTDGKITVKISNAKGRKLAVRVPYWCTSPVFSVKPSNIEKGYAYFEIASDCENVAIDYPMSAQWYTSNPDSRYTTGRVALMYGPVLYCAEKCDNNFDLWKAIPDTSKTPVMSFDEYFGENVFTVKATVLAATRHLYDRLADAGNCEDAEIRFIPYAGFANRGKSDMKVWFQGK